MNNYNFTQTLDGLNSIDASSISTDGLDVNNFIANTATITTLSNSNLVNCQTSTTPSIPNSIVNKSYVDDNFVDKTTNQSINGLKLFLNKLEVYNTASNASLTLRVSSGTSQQSTISQNGSSLQFLNNSTTPNITYLISGVTRLTMSPTQFLLDATCFLTTNDIKSRLPTGSHSLLTDISTGSLVISSATASNTINGSTSFSSIPLCSISATTANQLVNFTTLNAQGFTTLPLVQANNNVWTGTNTFNTNLPTSTLTPSSGTQLITKSYADGSFLDFVTDQTISGTKRFNTIFTGDHSWRDVVTPFSNRVQSYVTGSSLVFVPQFNNNTYTFYCKDSVPIQTSPLTINSTNTTINNNFISNGQATFNNICPISNTNASLNNHLTTLGFNNSQYIDFTTDQTINATNKRFNGLFCTGLSITPTVGGAGNRQQIYITGTELSFNPLFNSNYYRFYCRDSLASSTNPFEISSTSTITRNNFISNGEATFNTWLNLNFRTRIYDLNGLGNYTQMYMIGGNEFVIGPNANGDKISFYCKDSITGTQTNTFFSSSLSNTSNAPFICNGIATFNNGAIFNTSLPTSTLVPNNQYQLVNKNYVDSMPVHQILNTNNIWTGTNTYNTYLPTSTITPSSGTQLVTKNYCDSNFMYKIGSVNENITGEKTFQSSAFFTGSNGYFMINANMSSGTLNPASENGTIGIIGLKDQTNDKFLLTLYGNIHASVKLNFSGVSMGFGGGSQIPNTQVLCNGTNVVIKPSLQFSGDSTIQNSAFTGAGSLNGTYNLANMTIDTNGKITALSSALSSNNNFSGFNTFSNGLTIKSTLLLKDITNSLQGTIDMASGGILLISSDNNSGKVQINTYDSGGSSYNRLFINETECNITVPITLNLDYTYYNPFNFTSTRLGYITSNTGSTATLTTGTGSNSGQLNLPAGSWNICYTATITVITNTLTTLNSLEVFLADSFNADLNIIGLDVLNYYKISTISIGQKFKISASGNLTSYSNTNTQYNLRLIPNFVAGSGGLNFQGSISATRNA